MASVILTRCSHLGTCKDDSIGSFNVLEDHIPDLRFNVGGLVSHGHFGDARQIDEREVEHVGRVDLVYGMGMYEQGRKEDRYGNAGGRGGRATLRLMGM
jgi:hypothetical protein